MTTVELAKKVNLAQPTVSQTVLRGKKIAEKQRLNLKKEVNQESNGRPSSPHPAGGPFTLTAGTVGYSSYTGSVSVEEGAITTKDITITPTRGDINGDGVLNQDDANIALQILAGKNPAGIRPDYASSGADVNGDGRIGMEEVIYIKEKLEGVRPQ